MPGVYEYLGWEIRKDECRDRNWMAFAPAGYDIPGLNRETKAEVILAIARHERRRGGATA